MLQSSDDNVLKWVVNVRQRNDYKQISDTIIHAVQQITVDQFFPENIVHFTKYEK